MEYVLLLFYITGALGAFDTIYHHELSERLPWKRSAHKELWLHGIRSFFYAVIFFSLAWIEWHGFFAWFFIGILIVEVLITLWDFVIEDQTRKLPSSERVTHTILAINYGIILALLLPQVFEWGKLSTGFAGAYYGWLSWGMTVCGIGVLVWAFRDYLRSLKLRKYELDRFPEIKLLPQYSRILVTGGTGFIGRRLCQILINAGHDVVIVTRDKQRAAGLFTGNLTLVDDLDTWNQPCDVLINLAGAPIGVRWTEQALKRIKQSRMGVTSQVLTYIERVSDKPKVLISGSAIGFYGNSETATFSENTPPADQGFTHTLCDEWEKLAQQAAQYGVRVCTLRTGLVLGIDGGVLAQLLFPFELFVGGKFGVGRQFMSWIHINDLIGIIFHCINQNISGAMNGTAPQPVTNEEFSLSLGKVMHRPSFMAVPAVSLKLLLGVMAEKLLLEGQAVIPEKALATGYQFQYETLDSALQDILRGVFK